MPIDENHIEQLVLDEMAGIISPEDSATLKRLLEEEPEVAIIRNAIYAQFQGEEEQAFLARLPDTLPLEKVWAKIRKRRWVRVYLRISYALIACIVIGVSTYMYLEPVQVPAFAHSLPLKSVALQLPDGETIPLGSTQQQLQAGTIKLFSNNKKVSYENRKPASGRQLATLTVPPGKDYTIELQDGTTIQLNAGSRLQFPLSFKDTQRVVRLDGEAYFMVAHDGGKPFVVQLPHSQVEVLGTAFNVNTYDSGRVKVALVSGSVRFKAAKDSQLLRPGYAVMLSDGEVSRPSTFDADVLLAWREGVYVFHAATIEEMCKVLTRWYGTAVVYDSPGKPHSKFTGAIDRKQPITEFLENLQFTGKFEYHFDKDSVLHIH